MLQLLGFWHIYILDDQHQNLQSTLRTNCSICCINVLKISALQVHLFHFKSVLMSVLRNINWDSLYYLIIIIMQYKKKPTLKGSCKLGVSIVSELCNLFWPPRLLICFASKLYARHTLLPLEGIQGVQERRSMTFNSKKKTNNKKRRWCGGEHWPAEEWNVLIEKKRLWIVHVFWCIEYYVQGWRYHAAAAV